MKKQLFKKNINLQIDNIFRLPRNELFHIGMTNPTSIFKKLLIADSHKQLKKLSQKKQNQIKAGREAQQDGENVKNDLAVKLSYKGNPNDITSQALILLNYLNISKDNVSFINTKAYADGRISCAKSDLKSTIKIHNGSNISHQISLKSTFGTTQVSVHSVTTFEKHLFSWGVTIPPSVVEFLTHFTNAESNYTAKPTFIFTDSKRRSRFTGEEINAFNSSLWVETQDFFKENAKTILEFLLSKGAETNSSNFATLLAFCDKKCNNLMFVDIQKLIAYTLQQSSVNNTFCVFNKPTKNGITTISLFNNLIVFQMKGSGTGAGYHSLQFRISGNKIKKLIENNLI